LKLSGFNAKIKNGYSAGGFDLSPSTGNGLKTGLMLAVTLLAAGCSSPLFEDTIFDQREYRRTGGAHQELARIKTGYEMTSLECQRLAEQIKALDQNQQLIDNRLRNIETKLGSASGVDRDVAALRNDLEQFRRERERLRKEITDDLVARIETIAQRQQKAINDVSRQAHQAASGTATSGVGENRAVAGSGYEHKVERGQTLSEIARGYNTTIDKIIKANNIKNPSSIRVGQILFIPD
jgi:predicted  nucleic acid-binding Zn-ribbon protein